MDALEDERGPLVPSASGGPARPTLKIEEPTDCTRTQWLAWYRRLSPAERWRLAMTRANAFDCDRHGRVVTQPQGRYTDSGVQVIGHDPMTAYGKLHRLIANDVDMAFAERWFLRGESRVARATED